MTQNTHTEAEQTRKLWREYIHVGRELDHLTSDARRDHAESVRQVPFLMTRQYLILGELLGLRST